MKSKNKKGWYFAVATFALLSGIVYSPGTFGINISYDREKGEVKTPVIPPLDLAAYDLKLKELANNPPVPFVEPKIDPETGEPIVPPPPPPALWPVKAVYPNAGAILPFNRIVAYYGNLSSTRMGVLGQYPEEEMLAKLETTVKEWELADPATPVLPALHYIAVVAQEHPGADGKHRGRMSHEKIEEVLEIAEKINALVFLDIQVGFSDLPSELPRLEEYFRLPNVHLGIDPEFSMKGDIRPGKVVGTFDAVDINFAANFLAEIVAENDLPPKVLVVHRYTQNMVTNYREIIPLPEVQIVMHMDGWGVAPKKKNTYEQFIYSEPVQFTGFKLFYKNDLLTPGTALMTPLEVLGLRPKPSYIQYQ